MTTPSQRRRRFSPETLALLPSPSSSHGFALQSWSSKCLEQLLSVCLTSLLVSFRKTADLLNAFKFFLEGASGHSRVAAGNFCCTLRAELQRRKKQNYFPRGKLKLTREKVMGVPSCMGQKHFASLGQLSRNSFFVMTGESQCSGESLLPKAVQKAV